jgi:hypothetical protein
MADLDLGISIFIPPLTLLQHFFQGVTITTRVTKFTTRLWDTRRANVALKRTRI